MGMETGHVCRSCGTKFTVQEGDSRKADVLHCDACGARTYVLHEDVRDLYLRYLRHPKPYLNRPLPGSSSDYLWPAEYHAAVEDRLGPCPCGGTFRYVAPPRCPTCRSTEEMLEVDEEGEVVFHD